MSGSLEPSRVLAGPLGLLCGGVLSPSGFWRIGEALHPGPPLRVAVFNATSVEPLLPWLATAPFDVAVAVEARVVASRVASVTGFLQRSGWNAVVVPATLGPGGRPTGGFLVACRAPRGLFLVPRRVAGAGYAARWCHALLEDGSPSGGIHFFPVYCETRGNASHLRAQSALLANVFEEAAALGDVRATVLGDFNSTPQESPYI